MNTFDEESLDLQLHGFLDGDLGDAEQQELLSRLSVDHDLRRHLNELADLKSAMKTDAQALVVPPETTTAVFAAVGYSPLTPAPPPPAPGVAQPAAAGTASLQGIAGTAAGWSLARKVSLVIVGLSITAAVITLWPRGEAVTPVTPATSGLTDHGRTSAPSPGNETGTTPAGSRDEANLTKSGKTGTPRRTVLPAKHDAGSSVTAAAAAEGGPAIADSSRSGNTFPAAVVERRTVAPTAGDTRPAGAVKDAESGRDADRPARREETPSFEPGKPAAAERQNRLGISITLRGMAAFSSPSTDVKPQSNTVVRNFAAGAGYALDDAQSAGIEAGRETFAQMFGRVEDGLYARYAQNPLEFWITAYYERTVASAFDDAVKIDARVNAGSALRIGPMLRGSIGVRVPVLRYLDVFAAAEAGITAYKFESLWLTTKTIGGTAGIRFSL